MRAETTTLVVCFLVVASARPDASLSAQQGACATEEGVLCAEEVAVGMLQTRAAVAPDEISADKRRHRISADRRRNRISADNRRAALAQAEHSSLGVLHEAEMTLVKSTFAVSERSMGTSMRWKLETLPTFDEKFEGEMEGPTDKFTDPDSLPPPDGTEGMEIEGMVDLDALPPTCGMAARVQVNSTFNSYDAEPGLKISEMSHFSLHGVYAGSSHYDREAGGLTVQDVEDMFDEELGDFSTYSPWMDIHVGLYDNDIDGYISRWIEHESKFIVLEWPIGFDGHTFHSAISHAPGTQEVVEIMSANPPSDPDVRAAVQKFNMPRQVFTAKEVAWLIENSTSAVQVHISRTARDLARVSQFYKEMFDEDVAHEVHDEASGASFVSFWHQSKVQYPEVIRVQVMFWMRPDQQGEHTTAWLEQRMENINAKYMVSYKGCWPVWGDNHYSLSQVNEAYFSEVRKRYDEKDMGYMLFSEGDALWTGYFPLPGGSYLELRPDEAAAPEGTQEWDDTYCYEFTCPGGR